MVSDNEKLIRDTLYGQWSQSNHTRPNFYYLDNVKNHNYRLNDAIKIYVISDVPTPKGLGYISQRKEIRVTLDCRSTNRDRMLLLCDEVRSVVENNRKSISGFDLWTIERQNKVANYINYFQEVFETKLLKYYESVP